MLQYETSVAGWALYTYISILPCVIVMSTKLYFEPPFEIPCLVSKICSLGFASFNQKLTYHNRSGLHLVEIIEMFIGFVKRYEPELGGACGNRTHHGPV